MKIQNIIIIVLFLYILFMKMCNTPTVKTHETKEHFIDSTITTTIDSSEIEESHSNLTAIQTRDSVITKDSTVLVYDTIPFKDIPLGLDTFIYPVKDSLFNGTITAYAKERPFINFDYRISRFTIKEKITIKDSVYHVKVKSYLSAGAMLSGSKTSFGFSPLIIYNHKTGNSYGVGYDLLNREVNLLFTKRF